MMRICLFLFALIPCLLQAKPSAVKKSLAYKTVAGEKILADFGRQAGALRCGKSSLSEGRVRIVRVPAFLREKLR